MPNRHERDLRNRDAPRSGLGPSQRPLLHDLAAHGNQRQTRRVEGRLRGKAPDRPRAGWARPLVHGHALGAADTRCATALRRGGPWACTAAIGTPQASLEERKAHTGFELARALRLRPLAAGALPQAGAGDEVLDPRPVRLVGLRARRRGRARSAPGERRLRKAAFPQGSGRRPADQHGLGAAVRSGRGVSARLERRRRARAAGGTARRSRRWRMVDTERTP